MSEKYAYPYVDESVPNFGLTKKEYYAAAALHGLLANEKYMESIKSVGAKQLNNVEIAEKVAGMANLIGDAMIKTIKP